MTSKRYLIYIFCTVLVSLTLIVGLNLYLNIFGLFGDRSEARIWASEKTSKYLLSFRYIPNNFEGVIIGSSVSANIDPKKIENFKIYNLSMNGGNISEIKYALDKVLQNGDIQYLVVCLYPYLTKNSGLKGRQISEKEYWGSLYSFIPIRVALMSALYTYLPSLDQFHDSEWGYIDSNLLKKDVVFSKILEKKIKKQSKEIKIDPTAYEELRQVVSLAKERGVKILAYYFPIYYKFTDIYRESGAWAYYQSKMNVLFEDAYVWDMNLPKYDYITHNVKAYSDGHLSDMGAEQVVAVISEKLNSLR